MITQELAELDPNELPFIDKEMNDQRHFDEAIFQVKSCIATLEDKASRSNRREAKEIIRIIQQNLKWEESPDLKDQIQLLQSLLYRAS